MATSREQTMSVYLMPHRTVWPFDGEIYFQEKVVHPNSVFPRRSREADLFKMVKGSRLAIKLWHVVCYLPGCQSRP